MLYICIYFWGWGLFGKFSFLRLVMRDSFTWWVCKTFVAVKQDPFWYAVCGMRRNSSRKSKYYSYLINTTSCQLKVILSFLWRFFSKQRWQIFRCVAKAKLTKSTNQVLQQSFLSFLTEGTKDRRLFNNNIWGKWTPVNNNVKTWTKIIIKNKTFHYSMTKASFLRNATFC